MVTVLDMVGEDVLHTALYTHKYPYDWRTREPVIIRASRQWFIDTQLLTQPALVDITDM